MQHTALLARTTALKRGTPFPATPRNSHCGNVCKKRQLLAIHSKAPVLPVAKQRAKGLLESSSQAIHKHISPRPIVPQCPCQPPRCSRAHTLLHLLRNATCPPSMLAAEQRNDKTWSFRICSERGAWHSTRCRQRAQPHASLHTSAAFARGAAGPAARVHPAACTAHAPVDDLMAFFPRTPPAARAAKGSETQEPAPPRNCNFSKKEGEKSHRLQKDKLNAFAAFLECENTGATREANPLNMCYTRLHQHHQAMAMNDQDAHSTGARSSAPKIVTKL